MDEISRQILINQQVIMSAIDEMQTFMVNIRATKQILDNHQKG